MSHYPNSVVRPVCENDLELLLDLAKQAGDGMTNLPQDELVLQKKIETSLHSFANGKELSDLLGYLFVIEDSTSKKVVGTSAICGAGSHMMPFYHFKMSTVHYVNNDLGLQKEHQILTMVNDYQGCTEVCGLFLRPDYREHHNGSLLSRSRFLFMADRPERFNSTIIAEMRGVMGEDGKQPFWDSVISNFIDLSFKEADALTSKGIKQFISDLMPRYPLYVELLPKEAQEVIDKVHIDTEPALALLKKEGFESHGYIDIFEAGTMVQCKLDKIKSVRKSKTKAVDFITVQLTNKNIDNTDLYIISNNRLDFKSCVAHLYIDPDTQELSISERTAIVLDIKQKDVIRFTPLKIN